MPPFAALAPFIIPAIGAAGGYIGQKVNANSVKKNNERNRQHDREMYAMQRKDNLADWQREAEFNSPEQQMNRLRQAGLNPHLVYGKGADATMHQIVSAKPNVSQGEAFQADSSIMSNAIAQGYQLAQSKAQTDQLTQSALLLQQEQTLKAAQTAKTAMETARGQFDLAQAKSLNDQVMLQARLANQQTTLNLRKTMAETKQVEVNTRFTLDENERKALQSTQDIQYTFEKILTEKLNRSKTSEEIKNFQQLITLNQKENLVKQAEVRLAEKNIFKGDPLWQKYLVDILTNMLKKYDPEFYNEYLKPQ